MLCDVNVGEVNIPNVVMNILTVTVSLILEELSKYGLELMVI